MKNLLIIYIFCSLSIFCQTKPHLIIKFENNSYAIKKQYVDSLAKINNIDKKTIIIKGYTDSVGKIQSNIILSEKRAKEVYKNLKSRNKKSVVKYEFFGECLQNLKDISENRKVEVYILDTLNKNKFQKKEFLSEEGIKIKYDPNTISITKSSLINSTRSMIKNKMFAIDRNGTALTTDGMIYLEMESKTKDTIEISIPSNNEIDTEMELYDGIEQEDGTTVWVLSKEKLSFNKLNNSYTFEQIVEAGKNKIFKNADKKAQFIPEFIVYSQADITNITFSLPSITFVSYFKIDTVSFLKFSNNKNINLDSSNTYINISYSKSQTEYNNSYLIRALEKTSQKQYLIKDLVQLKEENAPSIKEEAKKEKKTTNKVGFFKRLWNKITGKK